MTIYLFRGITHAPPARRLVFLTEFNRTAWSIEVWWQVGKPFEELVTSEVQARYRVFGLLGIRRRERRVIDVNEARRMVNAAARQDFKDAFDEVTQE
ncbi:hypothetical protein [Cupriavidus sp. UYPR2.512]|uniref:hypothetical protein n=1 Tax=Cupriavidus sp. UYPR2.512 TaxID=1080187 RepID=UPI000379D997|nr:hypothetical protein [Cupriavidus sp. UYPR2.512]UIF90940.1 hypothetical protein KAF44_32670 [Cupriavidus necator]